ncbi:MAG: YggS family pyridoxal phosphate-dependent enzyme [Planctomycetes bacterium]|nr:YggS family pyridoxal phosphate-dependent enzyme [Planctomycetota bacterium]
MSEIADNLAVVRARIGAACSSAGRLPEEVLLLAVSKTHPASSVSDAHAFGQRAFGENRVQELSVKAVECATLAGLQWHLIGSLQTNKVRALLRAKGLALLHSLDRSALADDLQKELATTESSLAVLLQIAATGEAEKHGCLPDQAAKLLLHVQQSCRRLTVCGLMAIGPLVGDPRPTFDLVVALREQLRKASGLPLATLSLGMSGDLEAAVAAGSTILRIGTAVFGARS